VASIFRHRWAAHFNHRTRDPIILRSGLIKMLLHALDALQQSWNGVVTTTEIN